jgi:hypothetical protein
VHFSIYVNGKMIPVETVPEMVIKENGGGSKFK